MTSAELMSPWPEEAAESARGFELDIPKTPRGGAEFARLTAAHRLLQDRLAGAALPAEVSDAITAQLDALAAELGAFRSASTTVTTAGALTCRAAATRCCRRS